MVINAEIVELQCMLLQNAEFDEQLFRKMMGHRSMEAFLEHEEMLKRGTTEETIRRAFEAGGKDDTRLMQSEAKENVRYLLETVEKLKREQGKFEKKAKERIQRFTDCEIDDGTTVYLYAIGGDGGYSLCEGELHINLLTNKEDWMDVLCHEMYHARSLDEACIERRIAYINLTEETDEIGDMLLSEMAEEGIATLIQFDGKCTVEKETVRESIALLQSWKNMTVGEREKFYHSLSAGEQRYAVASYLADKVDSVFGRQGLEQWSKEGRLDAFREILMQQ